MLNDNIQDAQKKGLISFEKDIIAELQRLSIQVIKQMYLVAILLLPHHIVPVFDGQYIQHQDRPSIGFPRDRYLVQDKNIERN